MAGSFLMLAIAVGLLMMFDYFSVIGLTHH